MNLKRKLLVAVALVAGMAMAFAMNVKRTPSLVQREVEALPTQQEELKQIMDGITDAYNRNKTSKFEKFFGLSSKKREELRQSEGQDPVKASLELLKKHGRKLVLDDIKFIAVENLPARFYVAGKLNGTQPVRFVFNKRNDSYHLLGITVCEAN